MGSATCFATMDIIFLSICELAVRTVSGRKGRSDDYCVYGDDVAIRSEYVDTFLGICTELHLKINQDKSYSDPKGHRLYRESCGIECLDGRDITPLRYSRFQAPILTTAPVDRKYWESTLDLMNRLLIDKYFLNTRSVVVELIKYSTTHGPRAKAGKGAQASRAKLALSKRIWEHALRVDMTDYQEGQDGPLVVVTPDGTATNYRARWRFNPSYQRLEVECTFPLSKPKEVHLNALDDDPELLDLWFFLSRLDQSYPATDFRKEESVVASAAGTNPDKWVWKWCPV